MCQKNPKGSYLNGQLCNMLHVKKLNSRGMVEVGVNIKRLKGNQINTEGNI